MRSILSLPLKVHKVVPKNEIDDKILEILEMVELPADFMYKSPNSIGGGEKQLVSIARALCCNPKFIILDEMCIRDSAMPFLLFLPRLFPLPIPLQKAFGTDTCCPRYVITTESLVHVLSAC